MYELIFYTKTGKVHTIHETYNKALIEAFKLMSSFGADCNYVIVPNQPVKQLELV